MFILIEAVLDSNGGDITKLVNLILDSKFWSFLAGLVKAVARFIKLIVVRTDDDPTNDNFESEEN